ncbi:PAS domain-containing protein [Pseudotabrizicola sediminis]|uniref:PAS domain-containing protein n=1 Tax=Pseudotabrizicola sediminis TaxID=2486418 RepID=A0ABY2KRF5_9RHOB|nr:PAS domain-containing protein [Pseudotabrizicola sediminis]TGD45261.1 PAS domain-containing protein [Pseudotabrizicola sediminis]
MTSGWSDRTSNGSDHRGPGKIAQLRAYWEALRTGDDPPRRDRVDPRGLAEALEHSFLIERIAPGIARFRIAGTAYNDLMGMDVRGMPLTCLFLGQSRDRLPLDLERVFRTPSILTLDLRAETTLMRSSLSARMQILPMLDQKGDATLAIGCVDLLGTIGRAPRRFEITQGTQEPLNSGAPVQDHSTPTPPPPRATPGVPHLRLVKV